MSDKNEKIIFVQNDNSNEGIAMLDLFNLFRNKIKFILVIIILFIGIGITFHLYYPKQYVSSSIFSIGTIDKVPIVSGSGLIATIKLIPLFDYSVNFRYDTCYIQFTSQEEFHPYFYMNRRDNEEYRIPAEYYELENHRYFITNISPPFDVIEIFAKNKSGIKSRSTFHAKPSDYYKNITGILSLNHYEHGIIVKFEEKEMSGMTAFLTLDKKGEIIRNEMTSISQGVFASKVLAPIELADVSEIKVYYESAIPYEIFKQVQQGAVIFPDSSFNFSLFNNN